MTDGIIKGTGNSRNLRTVANALTLYPTYEDFITAMVAGEFPVDLAGINPTGWQTVGDKLNKAVLLKDATATGMGLTASATPDQALAKLRGLIATAQGGVDTLKNAKRFMTGSYTGTQNSTTDYTTKVINTPGMKPLACFISGKGNTHPTGVFILLRDCAWTYNLLFDANVYIPSVRFDSNSIAIGGVAVPAYGVIEGGTNYSWLAIGE